MEDGNSLFDYDVGLNDIIQLMVRPLPSHSVSPQPPKVTNSTSHATPIQNGNGIVQNGNGTVENGNGATQNGAGGSDSGGEEGEEEAMEEEQIGVYRVSMLG